MELELLVSVGFWGVCFSVVSGILFMVLSFTDVQVSYFLLLFPNIPKHFSPTFSCFPHL
jgi:hypothetical protein